MTPMALVLYTLARAQLIRFLGIFACRLILVYYWLRVESVQAVFVDVLSSLEVQLCMIFLLLSRSGLDWFFQRGYMASSRQSILSSPLPTTLRAWVPRLEATAEGAAAPGDGSPFDLLRFTLSLVHGAIY